MSKTMELELPDPGLATLSEVLDPVALAAHLRGVALGLPDREIREVDLRVLRHVPRRRCTLEIHVRTDSGWHVLIGKVYRKDHSDVFGAMEQIQRAGFGSEDEFSIPEPRAYLPSLLLLLQERTDGQNAKEVFRTGDDQSRAAAAERSARWLARFHARAPKTGPVSPPADYLGTKRMQKCAPEISRRDASLASKVDRLQELLVEASSSLAPLDLCAGHGAYRPDHVILCPDRTIVFDFDTYDVADPARDVARFLVALRRSALELGAIGALDGPYSVFLKTYLAVGQPGVEKNLGFFEAAACLKRAKRLLSREAADGHESAEAMLDEGLRALTREVVG
jgi:aminoglycoside phosphotransferase (APT) family kinase protein